MASSSSGSHLEKPLVGIFRWVLADLVPTWSYGEYFVSALTCSGASLGRTLWEGGVAMTTESNWSLVMLNTSNSSSMMELVTLPNSFGMTLFFLICVLSDAVAHLRLLQLIVSLYNLAMIRLSHRVTWCGFAVTLFVFGGAVTFSRVFFLTCRTMWWPSWF